MSASPSRPALDWTQPDWIRLVFGERSPPGLAWYHLLSLWSKHAHSNPTSVVWGLYLHQLSERTNPASMMTSYNNNSDSNSNITLWINTWIDNDFLSLPLSLLYHSAALALPCTVWARALEASERENPKGKFVFENNKYICSTTTKIKSKGKTLAAALEWPSWRLALDDQLSDQCSLVMIDSLMSIVYC